MKAGADAQSLGPNRGDPVTQRSLAHDSSAPSREDLLRVFTMKYGTPGSAGWGPRLRLEAGYFTPDDIYEAVLDRLVKDDTAWVDVGGGRHLLPENPSLARALTARARLVVGVDPSANILENGFVHRRVRCQVEDFQADTTFDLATLRMVAEHLESPERALGSLARLVRPGGRLVVYTVHRYAPLSVLSRWVPFRLHNAVKSLFWRTEDRDTFPVQYKMNTRATLRRLVERAGFREQQFAYLADCRIFTRWRALNRIELGLWNACRRLGVPYPEVCLLGVYERREDVRHRSGDKSAE